MDSFEINKIIAAILLTALIIIGIGKFADVIFYVEKPEKTAYKIEGLEVAESSSAASRSAGPSAGSRQRIKRKFRSMACCSSAVA